MERRRPQNPNPPISQIRIREAAVRNPLAPFFLLQFRGHNHAGRGAACRAPSCPAAKNLLSADVTFELAPIPQLSARPGFLCALASLRYRSHPKPAPLPNQIGSRYLRTRTANTKNPAATINPTHNPALPKNAPAAICVIGPDGNESPGMEANAGEAPINRPATSPAKCCV